MDEHVEFTTSQGSRGKDNRFDRDARAVEGVTEGTR